MVGTGNIMVLEEVENVSKNDKLCSLSMDIDIQMCKKEKVTIARLNLMARKESQFLN